LYPYDDEPTRRFKRLLNFELPYRELDPVLRMLFEQFIGNDDAIAAKLYLSARICGSARTLDWRLASTDTVIACSVASPKTSSASSSGRVSMHCARPADSASSTRRIRTGSTAAGTRRTKRVAASLGLASASTKVRAITKPSDLKARLELPRYDVRDVFDASGALEVDRLSALFTAD
jgi:hypothetical protein